VPVTDKVPSEDMPNFEAALRELESIVSRLERGQAELEESIALYERGQRLKSYCEEKLKDASLRLEKIVGGAGGPPVSQPASLD